jgi:apolipoprotein N-acyltransferase
MNKKALIGLLPLISGVMMAAAWPERGLPVLLFFALVPLLWLNEQVRSDSAARKGLRIFMLSWATFMSFNAFTTWWIWNSTAGGAIMAIVFNALFMAVVWWLAEQLGRSFGRQRGYLALLLFWLSFEYLHLNWDLTWPWLQLGNGFAGWYSLVQWYEITGVLGGTAWVLVANILAWEWWRQGRKTSARKLALPLAWIVLPMVFSLIRYFSYSEQGKPAEMVCIQPNVDPYREKFNGSSAQQIAEMTRLAEQTAGGSTDLILFPETAIPQPIWADQRYEEGPLTSFRNLTKNGHTAVLTGVYYIEWLPANTHPVPLSANPGPQGAWIDDHNSALLLNPDGSQGLYHKSKLVPGVERLPFASVLKPIQHILFKSIGGLMGNMGTQEERTVLVHSVREDLRTAPIVCYESIFGEFCARFVRNGATHFGIITNDAWWDNTPGHRQLLAYARLRAIETRRSVARSANTGISCFINQRGDVQQTLAYETKGAIKGQIQLNESITPYVVYGDWLGRFSVWISGLLLLAMLVKRLKAAK